MQSQGLCPAGVGRHGVRSLRQSRRLGENHQVLAYGYDRSDAGEVTLRIYDPNHGPRDDLTMTFNPDAPPGTGSVCYSTGECVRGFFHTPYRRRRPGGPLPGMP